MYEVIEISMADARRLLQYKRNGVFGAAFNLKGFDYPWIITSREWSQGERVLDVGAGYSELPVHLADTYGCEVWAVDDFGQSSDEPFWTRGMDPHEHIAKCPQVRYVLERLGDPQASSLPQGYFDCIISASTLEHLPTSAVADVWRHMDALLSPGGSALHAVDIKVPVHRGLVSLAKAALLDWLYPVIPSKVRLHNLYYTPKCYVRTMSRSLGLNVSKHLQSLNLMTLLLDPGLVIEPVDWAYNRMVQDGIEEVPILRVGSLLLHMRKSP